MSESVEAPSSSLTEVEKARAERNRRRALEIRKGKLVAHPYKKPTADDESDEKPSFLKVQGAQYVDSGGGYLIEKPLFEDASNKSGSYSASTKKNPIKAVPVLNEAINIPVTYEECLECGEPFADSYLWNNFGHAVCDKCRDPDDKHALITRTEAKAEYLLKDCDFDRREPALRFVSRKNPHNIRWGEMKLYLHLQVEKRAMEVWGSEEELLRQHENRGEKREEIKVRKYKKQMKQLRMEVRSSLYTKETHATHVHEFGPDTYNEEDDNYTHSCVKCPYVETYEKM